MAPLGWSGGSQFSSTVLDVVFPITVSMRGGEGAEGRRGATDDSEYSAYAVKVRHMDWLRIQFQLLELRRVLYM